LGVRGGFRAFGAGVLLAGSLSCHVGSMTAQELPQYIPTRNISINNYKQYFQLSTATSTSSSGDTSSFVSEASIEIKPVETMNEAFTITDSFSTKGGSAITGMSINNFFPAGTSSGANVTDAGLESKFKDLSDVTLGLAVKSKEISEEDKKLVTLNANFNAIASTTLNVYTESSSPTFVSIFQDVLFNKKTITR
jgi:hypothetical protein